MFAAESLTVTSQLVEVHMKCWMKDHLKLRFPSDASDLLFVCNVKDGKSWLSEQSSMFSAYKDADVSTYKKNEKKLLYIM